MEFDTPLGIPDVVARDQDHGEEGLDDARRDVAEQLARDAPAHGGGADDEADDGDAA